MSVLSQLQKLLPDVKIELVVDFGFLEDPDDVFGKLGNAGFEIGDEVALGQSGINIIFCNRKITKQGGYSIIKYSRKE